MASSKILVKVGKSSTIKFRGVQAYRAITLDELDRLSELHQDAQIAIIENIKQSDSEKLKKFISKFESAREGNKVMFYVADNDDATCGVADELAYEIYLNLKNLYDAIKINYNIVVDPDLSLSAEYDNDDSDPFETNFDVTIEAIQERKNDTKELPVIESRDDLDDYDDKLIEDVVHKPKVDLSKPEEDKTVISDDIELPVIVETEIITENTSEEVNKDTTKSEYSEVSSNDTEETENTEKTENNTPSIKVNLNKSDESENKTEDTDKLDNDKSADNSSNELEAKITELETEVKQLKIQLKESFDRSKKLTVLVSAIETERDTFKEKLKLYDEEVVMEDPIPLSEYEELKEKLQKLTDGSETVGVTAATEESIAEYVAQIDALTTEKNSISEQLETYKDRLKESGSKFTEAQERIRVLTEELEDCKKQVTISSESESDKQALLVQIESLRSELNDSKDIVESAKTEIESLTNQKNDMFVRAEHEASGRIFLLRMLFNSIKELEILTHNSEQTITEKERIENELRDKLAEVTKQLNDANEAIKNHIENIASKEETIRKYEDQLSGMDIIHKDNFTALSDEYHTKEEELKKQCNEAIVAANTANAETVKNLTDQYTAQINDLSGQVAQGNEVIRQKDELIGTLNSQIETLNNQITDNNNTIQQLNTTIANGNTRITELENQVSEVDTRIDLARSFGLTEADKARSEATEWKAKFEIVSKQLQTKEAQYNVLVQTAGIDEGGASGMAEANKIMQETNKSLREQIVTLKGDLDSARKDAVFHKQSADQLKEINKNLNNSMKAMQQGVTGGGLLNSTGVTQITYTGRGFIIPVIGSGSFGTTTTAMSLAHKLATQAKVLFIDFDLIAPKADGWFKINPIIKSVPGVEVNSPKATGLGILVDKHIQYFMAYSQEIVLKAIQTKSGCIDYISGFYAKPDSISLVSTDFTSFLNWCGNNYTYVIVDFGRLGSSDLNDQLIKAFCDVAHRVITVTSQDKFEIRTFRMKLNSCGIDITNIAWLVNMCSSTNLHDIAKRAISPCGYAIMPFSADISGYINDEKRNFMQDRSTRDRMNQFIEKIVFKM